MTRLQETERAYLVAKLGYLNVLRLEIESASISDETDEKLLNTTKQYNACEKRLLTLDEEIKR